jgi:hypothetical protein
MREQPASGGSAMNLRPCGPGFGRTKPHGNQKQLEV